MNHYNPLSFPTCQIIKRSDSKADILNKNVTDTPRTLLYTGWAVCFTHYATRCMQEVGVFYSLKDSPGSLLCFTLTQCPFLHLPLKE